MEKLGLILYKIGDIGPEIIHKENMPIDDDFNILLELGLYVSLVISQGKGLNTEGLVGPIPWHRAPEHELMVYSFLTFASDVTDHRKITHGTMHFLIIIFKREDEAIINAKNSLKKGLDEFFETNDLVAHSNYIDVTLTYVKLTIKKALLTGNKIIQEKAFQKLITDENIDEIAIYSISDLKFRGFIMGNHESLPNGSELKNWFSINSNIIITRIDNSSMVLIVKFMERNLFFYIKINKVNHSMRDCIDIVNQVKISYEIIFSYL